MKPSAQLRAHGAAVILSAAATGVLWWLVEPASALMVGAAVLLASVVIAASLGQASRHVQVEEMPSAEVTSSTAGDREVPTHSAQLEELLARAEALSTSSTSLLERWEGSQHATAQFRQGLVRELAVTFNDVRSDSRAIADRLQDLERAREGDATDLRGATSSLGDRLRSVERELVRLRQEVRAIPVSADFLHQVEAIVGLRIMVGDVPLPLPVSGGWRAAPTTLLRYMELVAAVRPQLVVECGSGVSSVWVGHKLRQLGGGRCVALEHDAEFHRESVDLVSRHGLADLVEVRRAPLTERGIRWYDEKAFADLSNIDLVFVDGPPGPSGPDARDPALEELGPRMRVGGLILVDDSAREDEARLVERWQATGLVREVESSPDYKGWTVLEYVGADPGGAVMSEADPDSGE